MTYICRMTHSKAAHEENIKNTTFVTLKGFILFTDESIDARDARLY